MSNSTPTLADPSAPGVSLPSAKNPDPQKATVPLPEDMADWLSTQQAADLLGCTRRQFQDFAIRHSLPKKKVGLSAFYAPAVVEKARRDWQKGQATKDAPKKTPAERQAAAKKQTTAEGDAFSGSPAGDDVFYNQALSLIGQIVQQRGRQRR